MYLLHSADGGSGPRQGAKAKRPSRRAEQLKSSTAGQLLLSFFRVQPVIEAKGPPPGVVVDHPPILPSRSRHVASLSDVPGAARSVSDRGIGAQVSRSLGGASGDGKDDGEHGDAAAAEAAALQDCIINILCTALASSPSLTHLSLAYAEPLAAGEWVGGGGSHHSE